MAFKITGEKSVMLEVTSLFSHWTHVGDDGNEGVGDREGEALWSAQLEALLHKREALLPAEQTDVTQQMQRHLHILVNKKKQQQKSFSAAFVLVYNKLWSTQLVLNTFKLTTVKNGSNHTFRAFLLLLDRVKWRDRKHEGETSFKYCKCGSLRCN